PLVGRVDSRKNLHQGRFSRAVLADESVHFSLSDGEVDTMKGRDPRELLCDPLHFQDHFCVGNSGRGHVSFTAKAGRRLCWGGGRSPRGVRCRARGSDSLFFAFTRRLYFDAYCSAIDWSDISKGKLWILSPWSFPS